MNSLIIQTGINTARVIPVEEGISIDFGKWNNRDNHEKGGDFSGFGKVKDRFVLDFEFKSK